MVDNKRKQYYLPANEEYGIKEGEILVERDPKPSCKHCHGRGYVGLQGDKRAINYGQKLPCRCTVYEV